MWLYVWYVFGLFFRVWLWKMSIVCIKIDLGLNSLLCQKIYIGCLIGIQFKEIKNNYVLLYLIQMVNVIIDFYFLLLEENMIKIKFYVLIIYLVYVFSIYFKKRKVSGRM